MQIVINNVVPSPLADSYINTGIWGNLITLESGCTYLVKAPSGKGKSTFINCIYGLRKDYTGSITFDGSDIKNYGVNQWAQNRQSELSVVFQDLRLFNHLTAFENIEIKRQLTGSVSKNIIEEMAEYLGVAKCMNQKVQYLSMGQQQRVAIIRALMQPFKWLLLDEPFSHLDSGNSMRAMQLICSICERQNAGLIVTSLGEDSGLKHYTILEV
ncbi:MAG: ATP-binding cassette domain-containing protein [Bacteroidota bacterium]